MSPTRSHARHLTWPPNIHLLPESMIKAAPSRTALKQHARYTQPLPRIQEDEDPFAHFLSPVLEEEEDWCNETSYSAGITPYVAEPSSKKDALFRARLEEKWETYVARRLLQQPKRPSPMTLAAPLPLPFPQMPVVLHLPSTPPGEDALPELLEETFDTGITSPLHDYADSESPRQSLWSFPTMQFDDGSATHVDDDQADGWESDRRRTQANGKDVQVATPIRRPRLHPTRTLSGKRHAWREPSPAIWPVEEEDEDQDRRRGRAGRKRCKVVHWNEKVDVVEYER